MRQQAADDLVTTQVLKQRNAYGKLVQNMKGLRAFDKLKREKGVYRVEKEKLKKKYEEMGKAKKFHRMIQRVARRNIVEWEKGLRKIEKKVYWTRKKVKGEFF